MAGNGDGIGEEEGEKGERGREGTECNSVIDIVLKGTCFSDVMTIRG